MAGLYIHIPFCIRKCDYCDFVSFADCSRMQEYTSALIREFTLREQKAADRYFDTVFIGGGTPSVLPSGRIRDILRALRQCFDIAPSAEITIECNPGTADEKKLGEYLEAGVNRLSLGVQSLDDTVLSGVGRIHTAADYNKILSMARGAGFKNINADIMYGLPGQSLNSLNETVIGIAGGVEHISAYSLILEEGTPLYSKVNSGKCLLPDEDEAYAQHNAVIDGLGARGYERYEISNYCLKGRECRHNLNYWDCGEYMGFGVAAHSAVHRDSGTERLYNTSDLSEYIAAVQEGRICLNTAEIVSGREEMFEYIMLGLRKTAGISYEAFRARFGGDIYEHFGSAIHSAEKEGWIQSTGNGLALSRRGLDMQNAALLLFMDCV